MRRTEVDRQIPLIDNHTSPGTEPLVKFCCPSTTLVIQKCLSHPLWVCLTTPSICLTQWPFLTSCVLPMVASQRKSTVSAGTVSESSAHKRSRLPFVIKANLLLRSREAAQPGHCILAPGLFFKRASHALKSEKQFP